MKVILSKKGFDTQYGKKPSVILPSCEMFSFPIPVDKARYPDEEGTLPEDINFDVFDNSVNLNKSITLYDVFKHLKIYNEEELNEGIELHLDPDIRPSIHKNCGFKKYLGAFGQSGSALGHLRNNNIGNGDLFLFYGTYNYLVSYDKNTNNVFELTDLTYAKAFPFHAIWGYLYVDFIIDYSEIDGYSEIYEESNIKCHPHYKNIDKASYMNGNSIYIGTEYGVFKYSENLRLTKKGYNKSYWSLPRFFKDIDITYNTPKKLEIITEDKCEFQVASQGQEFVFEANDDVENWIKEKIMPCKDNCLSE